MLERLIDRGILGREILMDEGSRGSYFGVDSSAFNELEVTNVRHDDPDVAVIRWQTGLLFDRCGAAAACL